MTRKTVNYGLEMKLFDVPAIAIVEEVSYPSLLQDGDGEDFWTPHTIWAEFHNKKLYEYDMGTTQKQWNKKRKLVEKDNNSSSMSVKDEYQLPFSETGYRSSIFTVGYKEKITKANLKKWLVGKAYAELGIKENTYAETSTRRIPIGVTDVKEFKLENTK